MYMYVYDTLKLQNICTCIGIFVFRNFIHIHMHEHVLVHLQYIVCPFLTNLKKIANWDVFRTGSSPELCAQVSICSHFVLHLTVKSSGYPPTSKALKTWHFDMIPWQILGTEQLCKVQHQNIYRDISFIKKNFWRTECYIFFR